jgi:hypothetical protein
METISWEVTSVLRRIAVTAAVTGAPPMGRRYGSVMFRPDGVRANYAAGVRRSVEVFGYVLKKSGDVGQVPVTEPLWGIGDNLPEWLVRLLAELDAKYADPLEPIEPIEDLAALQAATMESLAPTGVTSVTWADEEKG